MGYRIESPSFKMESLVFLLLYSIDFSHTFFFSSKLWISLRWSGVQRSISPLSSVGMVSQISIENGCFQEQSNMNRKRSPYDAPRIGWLVSNFSVFSCFCFILTCNYSQGVVRAETTKRLEIEIADWDEFTPLLRIHRGKGFSNGLSRLW